MTDFRVSVCAGQGFRIRPIIREYRKEDALVMRGGTVFRTPCPYVPECEYGGEG
jgi:hypothetical protein